MANFKWNKANTISLIIFLGYVIAQFLDPTANCNKLEFKLSFLLFPFFSI